MNYVKLKPYSLSIWDWDKLEIETNGLLLYEIGTFFILVDESVTLSINRMILLYENNV